MPGSYRHIAQLEEKDALRILGVMTGSSGDGVDWCQVEFQGRDRRPHFRILDSGTLPLPAEFREAFTQVLDLDLPRSLDLHFKLGAWFGEILRPATAGMDVVALHGQTLLHAPPHFTVQIGHPQALRFALNLPIIHDFRSADLLAGGQGAPLIPVVDDLLFPKRASGVFCVNIGGIANLTWLPPNRASEPIMAWDCGPGNTLLDHAVRRFTGGREHLDRNGRRARRGQPHPQLARHLDQHPYLALDPPKSAGQEQFGPRFLDHLLGNYPCDTAEAQDSFLHELTAWTVRCIHAGMRVAAPREAWGAVHVSGGGSHNRTLMEMLEELIEPVPCAILDQLGVNSDNKEAFGFAYLGYLNLRRLSGNLPGVTGAREGRVLGQICW